MRITQSENETSNYLVLFNDRPILTVLAADDQEGWIEIPDLARMAPLSAEIAYNREASKDPIGSGADSTVSEWEEIPILRKHGKVEIRKI